MQLGVTLMSVAMRYSSCLLIALAPEAVLRKVSADWHVVLAAAHFMTLSLQLAPFSRPQSAAKLLQTVRSLC